MNTSSTAEARPTTGRAAADTTKADPKVEEMRVGLLDGLAGIVRNYTTAHTVAHVHEFIESLATVPTAAKVFGVSPRTVYAWKKKGTLPAVQLGCGCVRFDQMEIHRFLECRKRTARLAAGRRATTNRRK